MKALLSNDTQSHAVSLESSTTPLSDSDLTSHFVCKLLHLRSNLLHQNRHVTCKIRHDFQRLAPVCHLTDADLVHFMAFVTM